MHVQSPTNPQLLHATDIAVQVVGERAASVRKYEWLKAGTNTCI
jgi:hypothetical protein